MHLTDDELHALVARNPSDPRLLSELRQRVRWNAIKARRAPRGTCAAGLRVYLDCKGPMSTGYIAHEGTHRVCNHGMGTWDRDERSERLTRLVEELRA